ncbi:MAG: hypothetical protein FJ109_05130 [Deltaproteobacteria bacterium]|nr:hypothetical protein [Deltaproteobacteria bacterium]
MRALRQRARSPAIGILAPLGILDLIAGQDEPKGEIEGVYESFGDMLLGLLGRRRAATPCGCIESRRVRRR